MSDDRPLLERSMVMLTGDTDRWYHRREVGTTTRRQINAVTVVKQHGGGNQSQRGFDRIYGGTQTEGGRTP